MIQDRDPGDETKTSYRAAVDRVKRATDRELAATMLREPRFRGHPSEDAFAFPPLPPSGLRPMTVDELRDEYGPVTTALIGPWGRT